MGKPKKRLPDDLHVSKIIPKNPNQEKFIKSIYDNEITIANGPAGVGKTYVAAGIALSLLGAQYKKIILVKSVTTIPGEAVGFIPGAVNDKMEPFVMSYT
jgi:phosphate starvation-inducible PhoH-like protein